MSDLKITKKERFLVRLQYLLLSLAIVAEPIYALPKRFQIPGLGGKLFCYFILAGLLIFFLEFVFFRFKIPKKILYFLGIILLWSIFTEVKGVIAYPYYDQINIESSAKLIQLIHFMQNHQIYFMSSDRVGMLWLFGRALKNIFLEFLYTFCVAAWVFHLFSNSFIDGFNKTRKYILLLALALGIYAIPEILLFKFHMPLGYEILSVTNPYLYDVGKYLNWYPPLIWPNEQLRSYCTEPSIFGFLAASIIPFSWSYLKEEIHWYSCLFYSYFIMLVFMTKSRTANAIALYNIFMLIPIFFKSKSKKFVVTIIALSCLGFIANIALNYVPNLQPSSVIEKEESIRDYYNENMKSIIEKDSRSNGSRLINIKSHLNIIKEHPLCGVGRDLSDCYVRDRLSEDAMNNQEISSITKSLNEKGPLGPVSYGNVNQYIFILTNSGIIGLIIYLFPMVYVSYKSVKLGIWKNSKIIVLLIALLGNLLSQMAGEGMILLYVILGLLYVGINERENRRAGDMGLQTFKSRN